MRKVLLVLLALLFFSVPLWAAASTVLLSTDSRAWYNHNSITIQVRSRDWVPYMGGMELSKAEFFNLTGEYELAADIDKEYKRVKKLNTAGKVLFWGGYGIGFAGIIAMYALMAADNQDAAWMSLGISLAAFSVGSIGLPLLYIKPKENVPVSFAIRLADNYNAALLSSL